MRLKLSLEEVKKRMIRLRNLEHLHKEARETIEKQSKKIKLLEKKVSELEEENKKKDEIINQFALQLEELRIKVFGKKKGKKDNNKLTKKQKKAERTAESYKRAIPRDEEITKEEAHSIDNCETCHTRLKRKRIVIYFEEDIPLDTLHKEVIKHLVEQGYCPKCRKWLSAIPLPKAKCVIGAKLRKYICYLSITLRLSYQQIEEHVSDICQIVVSKGEIQNLLEKEANILLPEFERLKLRIQQQKAQHYDESSWKVAKGTQGNEVWVMVGTETPEAVFLFGKSRGKGNVDILNPNRNIGITDGYGAYVNSFKYHQLCWAHLYRHFRDLAKSDVLSGKQKEACLVDYDKIYRLYDKLKQTLAQEFEYEKIHQYFLSQLGEFSKPNADDAPKLRTIKETLAKTKEKYLTCLKFPDIVPPDNNKAERSLRHIVIKRKISYGSKTDRGAETISTLASVLLSLKWMSSSDFFQKYLLLGV